MGKLSTKVTEVGHSAVLPQEAEQFAWGASGGLACADDLALIVDGVGVACLPAKGAKVPCSADTASQ